MNLKDLKYLLALIEHQHFGRAAEACFVSQPALSMQIKKLEETLGVQLLERTKKQVMITEAGKRLGERARLILAEVDNLYQLAREETDPFSGELKFGMIPTIAPFVLPAMMPLLTKQFPKVSFLLIEEQTQVLLSMLAKGELDILLLALPINDPKFETMLLYKEEFYLAVSKNNILAKQKNVRLSDLQDQNILLLQEGHCLRDQALDICYKAHTSETDQFKATSLETLRYMVASGAGVTLIPEMAKKKGDGIVYLPFKDSKPQRQIGLCWRKSAAKQQLIMAMRELLRG